MNFQVTILKVLVSYPDGFASLADVKRDVAILATSGREWSERTKRLAARLPGLEIFAQGLVERRDGGWRITDAGRSALELMETCPRPPRCRRRRLPRPNRRRRSPIPRALSVPDRIADAWSGDGVVGDRTGTGWRQRSPRRQGRGPAAGSSPAAPFGQRYPGRPNSCVRT